MTEIKRGRGRPKKSETQTVVFEIPEVPENPDCSPATKRYVKCLMRKYDKSHTHNIRAREPMLVYTLGIVAFGAWGLLVMSRSDPSPWSGYSWICGFVATSLIAIAFELDRDNMSEPATEDILFANSPKYLREWEPPKCDPVKKECE